MLVAEVMSPRTHVVNATLPLREAAVQMARHGVGFLPVRDGGRLVGVVTDRDLAVRPALRGVSYDEACVADVMSTAAHAIRTDISVEAAAAAMRRTGVRRLLVIDAAGRLAGVLSLSDMAAHHSRAQLAGGVLQHLSERRGSRGPPPRHASHRHGTQEP